MKAPIFSLCWCKGVVSYYMVCELGFALHYLHAFFYATHWSVLPPKGATLNIVLLTKEPADVSSYKLHTLCFPVVSYSTLVLYSRLVWSIRNQPKIILNNHSRPFNSIGQV